MGQPCTTASGAMTRMSADQLARWVEASCVLQGVPVKVTDARVVRQVATLLGAGSESPGDLDALGVQRTGTTHTRSDRDVIDHGSDDGGLAGQPELFPRAS